VIGYNGENKNPKNTKLNYPTGIVVEYSTGKIYIVDANNFRIRVLH
jgi:hypothetical protein